jgi:hypothetical protein
MQRSEKDWIEAGESSLELFCCARSLKSAKASNRVEVISSKNG